MRMLRPSGFFLVTLSKLRQLVRSNPNHHLKNAGNNRVLANCPFYRELRFEDDQSIKDRRPVYVIGKHAG